MVPSFCQGVTYVSIDVIRSESKLVQRISHVLYLFLYISILSSSISSPISLLHSSSLLSPSSLSTIDPVVNITFLAPIVPTLAFIAAQADFAPCSARLMALWRSSSENNDDNKCQLFHTTCTPGEVNMNAKHPLVSSDANSFSFGSFELRMRREGSLELYSTRPTETAQTTPRIWILPAFSGASELALIMAATSEG